MITLFISRPHRCSRSGRRPFARRRVTNGEDRAAFTLTELAIVVMVMGIFAAVAVPKFLDSLLLYRVEAAARRVKADLELLQRTARLTSAEQTISFAGSTYTLSTGANLGDPNDVYTVDLAASPYHVTSVSVDFGGSTSVSFNGYGAPAAGGDIVLATPRHECTISLDESSGEIDISRNYPGGRTVE